MDKTNTQMYFLAKYIKEYIRQTYPWLPERTIRSHAEACAVNLVLGLNQATLYQISGALVGNYCINYSVRDQ